MQPRSRLPLRLPLHQRLGRAHSIRRLLLRKLCRRGPVPEVAVRHAPGRQEGRDHRRHLHAAPVYDEAHTRAVQRSVFDERRRLTPAPRRHFKASPLGPESPLREGAQRVAVKHGARPSRTGTPQSRRGRTPRSATASNSAQAGGSGNVVHRHRRRSSDRRSALGAPRERLGVGAWDRAHRRLSPAHRDRLLASCGRRSCGVGVPALAVRLDRA